MQTRRCFGMLVLCLVPALAGPVDPVNQDHGLAVKGYDVVAYFTESQAVKGSPSFTHRWKGAVWQFSSAAHRDLFTRSPEKYAPQYGGYCAYGVSRNYIAPIDPEAWTVIDGKLYLNYSQRVKRTWSKEIPKYVQLADGYWPGLHK